MPLGWPMVEHAILKPKQRFRNECGGEELVHVPIGNVWPKGVIDGREALTSPKETST